MAKKRKKKGFGDWEFSRPRLDLPAETKQSIAAVFLILIGIVSFLSLFDMAGTAGVYINGGLTWLLGAMRWLGFILLMLVGYLLLRPNKYELRISNYIGVILLFVGLPALVHIVMYYGELETAAAQGLGGGYIGLFLASPLVSFFGVWAASIFLVALLLISLFLTFNMSFADFSEIGFRFRSLFSQAHDKRMSKRIAKAQRQKERDQMEDEEYEDDEEYQEDDETFESRNIDDTEEDKTDEEYEDDEAVPVRRSAAAESSLERNVRKFQSLKVDIPLKLLTGVTGKPDGGDLEANKLIIKKTLDDFNIKVNMGDAQVGPTVTQYTFKPAEGIRLSKITGLADNLALALALHPIRIEAPIPGRSLVGIEVPNSAKANVPLKDILTSAQFKKRDSNLMIAVGKDVMGRPVLTDLSKMPHLLIAGATGSGKSVFVNSLILSLLFQNGPGELKFIMVDPKRVELPTYNGIPHLLSPVITDTKKTINALRWSINEMERRFEVLSQAGKRNIQSYNQSSADPLPYIVFVIDELADLMATASAEVEAAIIRLAQMARAVGIHLVLATQRPSVDVITGLIKANVPARVAFSVASLVDSRTILDTSGAEKLLGRGDMLFITAEMGKPTRLQGAFASDDEIKNITDFLRKQAKPEYVDEVVEKQSGVGGVIGGDSDEDDDPLLSEAKEVILQAKKASASLLQRRLRVGYARAARILDILEQQGFIGPADGAKPREIMLDAFQRDAQHSKPEHDEVSDEDLDDDYMDDGEEDDGDYTEFDDDEEDEEATNEDDYEDDGEEDDGDYTEFDDDEEDEEEQRR